MKKSVKIKQKLEDAIVNMVNKINYYGGSTEVEYAYIDFRSDMFKSLDDTKNHKVRFTNEDCMELGKAILNAFNAQIEGYYKDE